MYPECGSGHVVAKGLCQKHYQVAFNLVKRGRTTWDELERQGKVRQKIRRDGSYANWFTG
jgi:hypothetical protein